MTIVKEGVFVCFVLVQERNTTVFALWDFTVCKITVLAAFTRMDFNYPSLVPFAL